MCKNMEAQGIFLMLYLVNKSYMAYDNLNAWILSSREREIKGNSVLYGDKLFLKSIATL